MSILNEPDHIIREYLSDLFASVEHEGGWAEYAVYCGGAGTEVPELNNAIEKLYLANEEVHRIANKLRVEYGVEW